VLEPKLCCSAAAGRRETVSVLLNDVADPHIINKHRNRPLDVATDPEVRQMLAKAMEEGAFGSARSGARRLCLLHSGCDHDAESRELRHRTNVQNYIDCERELQECIELKSDSKSHNTEQHTAAALVHALARAKRTGIEPAVSANCFREAQVHLLLQLH
jgi:hypothetical protein